MFISQTDLRHIQDATAESQKSKLLSRHGCVAVVNGKIVGRGHNSDRTRSFDGFINNSCSCHAEVATLRNMYHSCLSNNLKKSSRSIKGSTSNRKNF